MEWTKQRPSPLFPRAAGLTRPRIDNRAITALRSARHCRGIGIISYPPAKCNRTMAAVVLLRLCFTRAPGQRGL